MTLISKSWGPQAIAGKFSEQIEQEPLPSPSQVKALRAMRFQETLMRKARRVLGAIWHSSAKFPLAASLRVIDAVMRDKAVRSGGPVDPAHALAEPDGFCTLLDDVSAASLMSLYGQGAYVDSGMSAASAWAPSQRFVVDLPNQDFGMPGPMAARISIDNHFDAVVMAANEAREVSHSPTLLHGFCGLFDTGMAHCVALRDEDGALCAGVFGVASGKVFVVQGEFYENPMQRRSVFRTLFAQLKQRGYILADLTPVEASSIGYHQTMSSVAFCTIVKDHLAQGELGRWRVAKVKDEALAKAA